jgi:hypothetical protein
MIKILKSIFHFLFHDASSEDCVNCLYGTSTGEWCYFNCKGKDKFVNKYLLTENDKRYYEKVDH